MRATRALQDSKTCAYDIEYSGKVMPIDPRETFPGRKNQLSLVFRIVNISIERAWS